MLSIISCSRDRATTMGAFERNSWKLSAIGVVASPGKHSICCCGGGDAYVSTSGCGCMAFIGHPGNAVGGVGGGGGCMLTMSNIEVGDAGGGTAVGKFTSEQGPHCVGECKMQGEEVGVWLKERQYSVRCIACEPAVRNRSR